MNEELENLILSLTINFERMVPENEKERTEIVDAFNKYMQLALKTAQKSTVKYTSKDLESIKMFLINIAKEFYVTDLSYIKRTLLRDSAFEEIRQKSVHIFEMAQRCMQNKKKNVEIDSDAEFNNMKKLFQNVKEYNQQQARELISEAILDLEYITSLNDNVLSLRLYHFQETLKDMEVER